MSDKRQFFRIQQNVILNFKAVSTDIVHQGDAEQHFSYSTNYRTLVKFQQLDDESTAIMHNIRKNDPDLGRYLETLNKKVNLLSQQLLAQETVTEDQQITGRVSLSQGGIAFTSSYSLNIESWIAVKLVFLPEYHSIISYAQITRSQKLDGGRYLLGACFYQLNDEEQRIIAKQVIDTQIIQKQQSRNSKSKVDR